MANGSLIQNASIAVMTPEHGRILMLNCLTDVGIEAALTLYEAFAPLSLMSLDQYPHDVMLQSAIIETLAQKISEEILSETTCKMLKQDFLLVAVKLGATSFVSALRVHFTPYEFADYLDDAFLLHEACYYHDPYWGLDKKAMVRQLLEYGADPNGINDENQTCVEFVEALERQALDAEILTILTEYGFDDPLLETDTEAEAICIEVKSATPIFDLAVADRIVPAPILKMD